MQSIVSDIIYILVISTVSCLIISISNILSIWEYRCNSVITAIIVYYIWCTYSVQATSGQKYTLAYI